MDIDVQGVKQIKTTSFKPWYIFVSPPSLHELEARLRGRKTETEESLRERLRMAGEELKYGETPGNFDLNIVNNDLCEAYNILRTFLVDRVFDNDLANGN